LDRAVEIEVARSSRTGHPFVVVYFDVDGLKRLNDKCGHRAGDRAIRRVANVLRVSSRITDTVARIGGDEFAVVLHGSDENNARQYIERVRSLLAGHYRTAAVDVSAGVAEYPRDAASRDAMIDVADRALYVEKRQRKIRGTIRRTPARSASTHAIG
jgi:diguanylate cyclase (GGDEF)-like protein